MRRFLATTGILIATCGLPGEEAAAQALRGSILREVALSSGPSVDYPPVATLQAGTEVTIEGCLDGRSWCDVGYGEARGWVAGSDVAIEHQGRRAPVAEQGPDLAVPTVPFALRSYWDAHYRQRPWYADRDRWASRDEFPAARPPTLQGHITGNVNLWAGPGTDYPPVAALPTGTVVVIEGCLEDRMWCDVGHGEARGWVGGRDLAYDHQGRRASIIEHGPAVAVPTLGFSIAGYWDAHYRTRPWYRDRDRWASRQEPAQAASPPPAAAVPPAPAQGAPVQGYVTTNVNLRAGPSTAYPRVTTLPAGAAVVIHGCLEGWTWCDIVYADLRGWVAGSYVACEYEGRRVHVVEYGPRLALPIVTFALASYWDHHYRARPWYGRRDWWAGRHYHPRPRFVPHRVGRIDIFRDHRRGYRHYDHRRHDYRPYRHGGRHWSRHDYPRLDRHFHRGGDRGYRGGGRRGYSGGQTERDAARFNRQRRGPMPGE